MPRRPHEVLGFEVRERIPISALAALMLDRAVSDGAARVRREEWGKAMDRDVQAKAGGAMVIFHALKRLVRAV